MPLPAWAHPSYATTSVGPPRLFHYQGQAPLVTGPPKIKILVEQLPPLGLEPRSPATGRSHTPQDQQQSPYPLGYGGHCFACSGCGASTGWSGLAVAGPGGPGYATPTVGLHRLCQYLREPIPVMLLTA